jgi:hypothetical protein
MLLNSKKLGILLFSVYSLDNRQELSVIVILRQNAADYAQHAYQQRGKASDK